MTRNPGFRPQSRSDGLIVERLPGELLVYDEQRDEAHCLHAEAAAVFDLVDGSRTGAEIAALASEHLSKPVSAARVAEVLAELDARHLLEGDGSAADGLSRRNVIHRGALTGAGVAGAALITSIAAPVPAAAQSGNGECDATPGNCSEEERFCAHSQQTDDDCFCLNTTEGPRCLDFTSDGGLCSQQGGCPSGSYCVDDETCELDNGVCVWGCEQVPEGFRRSSRRSRSLGPRSFFKRR